MIPLSFEFLRRKMQKDKNMTSLQEISPNGVFTYTIYSPNAKKKYLKMLNKFKSQIGSQNNEIQANIKGKDLFYKYLKALTSRIRMVEIKLNTGILLDLLGDEISQEYPFIINQKHPLIEKILKSSSIEEKYEEVIEVALLETRVSKHIQNFNYLFMRFDPKIFNQEQKIQKKITKFNKKKQKKEESEIFIDIKDTNSDGIKNNNECLEFEKSIFRTLEFET